MANRFKKAAESRRESVSPAPTFPEVSTTQEIERPVEEKHAEESQAISVIHPKPAIKSRADEDDSTVAMSLRIPISMRDALRLRYARTGEKMTSYIKRLIEEDMRNNPF